MRLHRWFGISTVAFAVVLSVSGILLNHADDLGLGQRYVQAEWLLDWYGIEAPPPAASYRAGAHRATQLGERLYFDRRELKSGAEPLRGMVELGGIYVIATGDRLLLTTAEGELIEELELPAGASDPGATLGLRGKSLIVRRGERWYSADESLVALEPIQPDAEADDTWSVASAAPRDHIEALQQLYRGRGVTGERLLADVHSGRLFGRYGPWVMDAAGLALLVLGLSGVFLFLRRKKR